MTNEYTLYELAPADGGENRFSPYTWRTKADLALLGISYETVSYTFPQIRSDLAKATGNPAVTVPTLQTPKGYVTDSWDIAVHLDNLHPGILFPSADGRAAARLLQSWVDAELAPTLRDIFRPLTLYYYDDASFEYFLKVKNGPAEGSRALAAKQLAALDDPEEMDRLAVPARAKLALFDRVLADSPGPFVLAKPSHADAAVWGWFVSTQLNARDVNPRVWMHPDLPHVAAWVEAMTAALKFTSPFSPVDPERKKKVLAALGAQA